VSHPSANGRSMAEKALIQSLDHIIVNGHTNERQLAKLCRDLIRLTGNDRKVRQYIDMQAVQVLNEEHPWD